MTAMRFWGKLKIEDRIIRDLVQEEKELSGALESLCNRFDIGKPIVCDKHAYELSEFRRTVFYPDDFIEAVDFDTFEIEIIDKQKNKSV